LRRRSQPRRSSSQPLPNPVPPRPPVPRPVELTPGNYNANLGTWSHGELQMTNVTLSDCLKLAYGISNDIQIEGPAWIRNKDVRFDITAKAALPEIIRRLREKGFEFVTVEQLRASASPEEFAWLKGY